MAISFFRTPQKTIIATQANHQLTPEEIQKLCWLYGGATLIEASTLDGTFVGPRREMITPWSTNAVEITQNMAIQGIQRIEEYYPIEQLDNLQLDNSNSSSQQSSEPKSSNGKSSNSQIDPMLQRLYVGLNQDIFTVNIQPAPIQHIENLEQYNEQEGLALSPEEIE